MHIAIQGYDIVKNTILTEETMLFNGVAHIERDTEAVDLEFEGTHIKDQIGFQSFYFIEPDQAEDEIVREKSEEIRDALMDYLLKNGWNVGEYQQEIPVS